MFQAAWFSAGRMGRVRLKDMKKVMCDYIRRVGTWDRKETLQK